MTRRYWMILAVLLMCPVVLFGFSTIGSASIPKIPLRTLPSLSTPAPTLMKIPIPHKTLKLDLPTPTPAPTLGKIPKLPLKTLKLDLPTPTPAPTEDPGIDIVATTMPGLDSDPYAALDSLLVIELSASTSLDLDGSGPMDISLTWDTDEYGSGTYELTAGSATANSDCVSLAYKLYAAKLAGFEGAIYLLVPDYGESDDPVTYVYKYEGGALHKVGDVPALPDTFTLNGDTFTTMIRAMVLQTWFRPADFSAVPNIHEVRRDLYPMGTEVKLLMNLPLYNSRTDHTVAVTLNQGTMVVLATTDDMEWVNVIKSGDSAQGGWLHLTDSYYCDVGGVQVSPTELFEGLFLAD